MIKCVITTFVPKLKIILITTDIINLYIDIFIKTFDLYFASHLKDKLTAV